MNDWSICCGIGLCYIFACIIMFLNLIGVK